MTFTTQPIRDTSRDSSPDSSGPRCPVCAEPLPSSRARYCSPAHRQRAFRLRHVQLASVDERHLRTELRRRAALVAHTVVLTPEIVVVEH